MSDKKYKVGDTVYFDSDKQWHSSREVTIEKVGRSYLHLSSGYRANKKNLQVTDGEYGIGWLHPSKAVCDAIHARSNAWHVLRNKISRNELSDNITTEAIHEAAKLLGIELGEEQGK